MSDISMKEKYVASLLVEIDRLTKENESLRKSIDNTNVNLCRFHYEEIERLRKENVMLNGKLNLAKEALAEGIGDMMKEHDENMELRTNLKRAIEIGEYFMGWSNMYISDESKREELQKMKEGL